MELTTHLYSYRTETVFRQWQESKWFEHTANVAGVSRALGRHRRLLGYDDDHRGLRRRREGVRGYH